LNPESFLRIALETVGDIALLTFLCRSVDLRGAKVMILFDKKKLQKRNPEF